MDISEFIKAWIEARGISAYDVNSGECENFAQDLQKTLPGSRLQYIEEFFEFASRDWPGGHIWVLYEGRLYDSESPTGVTQWSELPFYQRIAEAARLRGL